MFGSIIQRNTLVNGEDSNSDRLNVPLTQIIQPPLFLVMKTSKREAYQSPSALKKANLVRLVLLLPKPVQIIAEYLIRHRIYQLVIDAYVPGSVETSLRWTQSLSSNQLQRIPASLEMLEAEFSHKNLRLLPARMIKPVRRKVLEFYYQCGVQALRQRDYESALEYSTKAIKFAPYNARFWTIRRRALFGLGRGTCVSRYINYLASVVTTQNWIQAKLIERIVICGYPQTALSRIVAQPHLLGRSKIRALQVRCYTTLRQFGRVQNLLDKDTCQHLPRGQVDLARDGVSMLKSCNINVNSNDTSIEFAEYLLAQCANKPLLTDAFCPRSVMILTHSMGIGGSERQTKNIIDALITSHKTDKVFLLVKEEPKDSYALANYGERLVQFNVFNLSHEPFNGLDNDQVHEVMRRYCRAAGLRDLAPIVNALAQYRPEVVHIRNGMHAEGALAALIAGVPRVIVHFGSMTREQQGLATELEKCRFRQIEEILSVCAKHPVFGKRLLLSSNSRAAAQSWGRACDLADERCHVIPNIIDHVALGMSHPPPFNYAKKAFVIGGVFRFASVKDPKLWIDTAHRVIAQRPETHFILVGDGPMLAQIQRMIDSKGLRQHFEVAGSVTQGLAEYLARMDIFLLSTRTESMPNAVLEAQLMGLPVIAPDVGGMREALAAANTGMITTRNASDLAKAVITAMDDPVWRQEVRERAPALIKTRFSIDAAVSELLQAYNWE